MLRPDDDDVAAAVDDDDEADDSHSLIATHTAWTLMRYWFRAGMGTGLSVSYFRDAGPPGVGWLVNEEGRWMACIVRGTRVCWLIVLDVMFMIRRVIIYVLFA